MSYRTLIIDDEPSILETLTIAMEERGHEALSAADIDSSPTLCNGNCPCDKGEVCANFLVIDQNLPGTKGLDYIEQLNRKGCNMPPENRAIMSAYLDNEELARADRLGCKVLNKPVTFTKLNVWLDQREPMIDSNCRLASLPEPAAQE